jgi:hypothetical protein
MSLQILGKVPNIKFRENSFSGSRFVTCEQTNGQTGRDTEDDVRTLQLLVANATKKQTTESPLLRSFQNIVRTAGSSSVV